VAQGNGGGMVSLFSSNAERRRRQRRGWEFEFAGIPLLILLVLEGVHGALMKIWVVGREGVAGLFRLLDERDSVSKSSSSFSPFL